MSMINYYYFYSNVWQCPEGGECKGSQHAQPCASSPCRQQIPHGQERHHCHCFKGVMDLWRATGTRVPHTPLDHSP